MIKTMNTFRYLTKSYPKGILLWFFLTLLANVAITDLVFYLTDRANGSHFVAMAPASMSLTVPFEVTAGIFALLVGMVLFIADFKVVLANGISRKTFFLANLPSAALAATALTMINLVVMMVHGLFWPINSISDLAYPTVGWAERLGVQFAFQFSLYILLIMTGRLITLAYYRSSTQVKWAISLTPFVLIGLLGVEDSRSGGRIFEAIFAYLSWSLRFPRAAFLMLAYAAILYGLVYLLIRRAPLKD